jgi:hypothetical protein
MPDPAPAPSAPLPVSRGGPAGRVVVRPLPKVVFFWLTWLASLVAGIVVHVHGHPPRHLGTLWMGVFALNLVVISFDVTETVGVAILGLLLATFFAGLYFGFLGFFGSFVGNLDVQMNAGFYFTVFGVFTAIYAVVLVRSRFEYWEFRNNEVLHRTGIFGEIKRYGTEDLRWFKEVPDLLERILLGAGRMVLTTPREPAPIVISHVVRIDDKDERIAELLGTKRVVVR